MEKNHLEPWFQGENKLEIYNLVSSVQFSVSAVMSDNMIYLSKRGIEKFKYYHLQMPSSQRKNINMQDYLGYSSMAHMNICEHRYQCLEAILKAEVYCREHHLPGLFEVDSKMVDEYEEDCEGFIDLAFVNQKYIYSFDFDSIAKRVRYLLDE